jgi:Cu2+-exporting ATPase
VVVKTANTITTHQHVKEDNNIPKKQENTTVHALRGKYMTKQAVCGMDLVKAPDLVSTKAMYTCPMHPEIIQEGPGSCPICGNGVPMKPTESEDNKTYLDCCER